MPTLTDDERAALTEQQRWVWVVQTRWRKEGTSLEVFSTRDKAVEDVRNYVRDLGARSLSSQGAAEILTRLGYLGDIICAQAPNELSIEIQKIKVL